MAETSELQLILDKIESISSVLTKFGNVTHAVDQNFEVVKKAFDNIKEQFYNTIEGVNENIDVLKQTTGTSVDDIHRNINDVHAQLMEYSEKIARIERAFKEDAVVANTDELIEKMTAEDAWLWPGKTVFVLEDEHGTATQYILISKHYKELIQEYNTAVSEELDTVDSCKRALIDCWQADNMYHEDQVPDNAVINLNTGYLQMNGVNTKEDLQNMTFTEIIEKMFFKEVYFSHKTAFGGKWNSRPDLQQKPTMSLSPGVSNEMYASNFATYFETDKISSICNLCTINTTWKHFEQIYGSSWAEASKYGYITAGINTTLMTPFTHVTYRPLSGTPIYNIESQEPANQAAPNYMFPCLLAYLLRVNKDMIEKWQQSNQKILRNGINYHCNVNMYNQGEGFNPAYYDTVKVS